jgi:DNA-binding LytR/AlgR family response regulator
VSEEAVEKDIYRYLNKNSTEEKINEYTKSIIEKLRENKCPVTLAGEYKHTNVKLEISDILYIEKCRYGCIAHVIKKKSENDFEGKLLIKEKLEHIYEKLHNYNFEYAHSSYIVNMSYVDECDKTQLILDGDIRLDISRAKSKNINDKFLELLGNKY